MLKKFYILALIFGLQSAVCNLYSQPSIQWQWLYPGPYDFDDYGYNICASDDGNFFMVGTARGWNIFPNFYVKKIDPNGNVIWSKAIGGASGIGHAYAVAPAAGGGCVVSGDGARFLKFNSNGDTVVNRRINDGNERRISEIKQTSDKGYIACGRFNINNALIIKFTPNGDTLWQKVFYTPYIKLLYDIDEAIDGGYIAVGRSQNSINDPIKLFIIKLGINGDSLWNKEHGSNISGVSLNKRKADYIVCGQRGIYKVDINGNINNSAMVDSLVPIEMIRDMKIIYPNRYIYTSIIPDDSVYCRVFLGDSLGKIIKSKTFKFSEYTELNKIHVCPNNDFIVMGYTYQYDTSSKSMLYAFRTDTTLNIPSVSIIGINPISSEIPKNFKLYQNYPNPFNPSTKIRFEIPVKDNIRITVYDITGRQIALLIDKELNAGTYETEFDGSNYSSGVYFISLLAGTVKFTRKIALIK